MRTQETGIEQLLKELGQARAQGLMGSAGRSLPWADPAAKSAPLAAPRRMPRLAAVAAMVAFALVGVWSLERNAPIGTDGLAENAVESVQFAKNEAAPAEKPALQPAVQSQRAIEGDYNGDGVVDGDDIPFFVRVQAQNKSGASESKDARELTRLLLGS